MSQDERIALALGFIALVALIIAKYKDALAPAGRAVNSRNFNAVFWQNVQGLANVIPTVSASQDGVLTSDVIGSGWGGGGY